MWTTTYTTTLDLLHYTYYSTFNGSRRCAMVIIRCAIHDDNNGGKITNYTNRVLVPQDLPAAKIRARHHSKNRHHQHPEPCTKHMDSASSWGKRTPVLLPLHHVTTHRHARHFGATGAARAAVWSGKGCPIRPPPSRSTPTT